MGYRCSPCDVTYPADRKKCMICGEATWDAGGAYDNDWRSQVEIALRELRFIPGEPIPNVAIKIVALTDGRRYVADELLRMQGYSPEPFKVVLIKGTYYELLDHFDNNDDKLPGGAWLIVEIVTEGAFDDLPVLAAQPAE